MPSTYHILRPRKLPALLSLVIPLYNEYELVPILRTRMEQFLGELPQHFATGEMAVELILVNDGSSDRTLELLLDWAAADRRIKVLGLARNFGHQMASTAGLDHARGDAIVLMDADLQDPLEVVHQMLAKYTEGYDVVYGQRNRREGETWLKLVTAWGFYRLMTAFVHPDLPPDTGDFRLISRPCLQALQSLREQHRFLRGMVTWVGFAQTAVRFDRPARAAGTTKFTLWKMLRFAWYAISSFSTIPLRVSLFAGVFIALFGLGLVVYAIIRWSAGGTEHGWTSQMAVTCLIGAAILVSNAILGAYVGQISEEIKRRPLYVVSMFETSDTDRVPSGWPAPERASVPRAADFSVSPLGPSGKSADHASGAENE
jgi:polyisoprenyl-phosphate glycosyltransferase